MLNVKSIVLILVVVIVLAVLFFVFVLTRVPADFIQDLMSSGRGYLYYFWFHNITKIDLRINLQSLREVKSFLL
jgi:hypothetical protein